jgi:hypothetical protein
MSDDTRIVYELQQIKRDINKGIALHAVTSGIIMGITVSILIIIARAAISG